MPVLREHTEQEPPGLVDMPQKDHRLLSQSLGGLHVTKKVVMAVSLAAVATVATLVLVAPSLAGSPERRGVVLAQNFNYYTLPDSVLSNEMTMGQLPSAALPSLERILTHAKSDREKKIREMEEKHRQKDASKSSYEKVRLHLEKDPAHGSGGSGAQLPSSGSRTNKPPLTKYTQRTPDPQPVEEGRTLQVKEEHDSRVHPKNVGSPTTSQPKTNPGESAVHDEESNKNTPKELYGMDQANSNTFKIKTAQRLQAKESDRLPARRLRNGSRVCETAECSEAATRISQSLDRSANPCDDFYQFACGGWIKNHSVPESGWAGTYIDAVERLDEALLMILEKPAEPTAPVPLHDIRKLYNSCMDLNQLDEIGLEPLVKLLSEQGGWPMIEEEWDPDSFNLSTALINLRNLNVYPLVTVSVNLDVFNTSRRLIFVDAGNVPLGVNFMVSISDATLIPYQTLMTKAARMFRDHIGSNVTNQDIDDQVQGVIEFEIKFSKIVMKAVNETTDHAWQTTVTELQEDTDGGTPGQFDWLNFLEEIFVETDITITEDEPLLSFKGPFFKDFSNMLATTDPRTLANALGWWWVYNLQQETTNAMRNASYDYLDDLYGISQPPSRQQHCLDITNGNLGFALSREYVDKFVPDSVKPETKEMVEDLRGAFSSLLNNNTWMLPGDLKVAREKLAAIDSFVAYPEWIMDDEKLTLGYEGLEIRDQEHMYNLVHIGYWFNLNSLAILRDVPEHSFIYTPTIVNALYTPNQNSIEIPAGILQPPFYAHNSLAALNYGGIGMIIGHEMTHGFDSTGRLYDKYGNLGQWWSAGTIAAFNQHALCFVYQYDKYIPPELSQIGLNIPVNGIQTLAENIADNGGIREAYQAYQTYVDRYGEEPRLPGLEEFSPEHIFYLGFANMWCEHKSPQVVLELLALDVHSPGRFRVLGSLSNDKEFSKVWNCPVGSPMNHGEDSCRLW